MPRFLSSIRCLSWIFGTIVLAGIGPGKLRATDLPPQSEWLKPPALRPGDTIAFVAPAGPTETAHLKEYAGRLENAGYHVEIPKGIPNGKPGYLAPAPDQARADEVERRDPRSPKYGPSSHVVADTVSASHPGSGSDYPALRRDPKIVTGFSDLTALHLAISREARVVTFHSPMPDASLWQNDKEHAFATSSFERTVFACQYKPGTMGYAIDLPSDQPRPKTLVGGKARARLAGGNLTLISSTLGTPYAIEPTGKILFIEDVHEAPYRIDRYLSQLRLAGVLDKIVGVVAGAFSSNDAKDAKELDRVLGDYFSSMKIPVLTGFPAGHIARNATLPIGALVELDADAGSLRVLENPVRLDRDPTAK